MPKPLELADEVPVAMVYDGVTLAVMMATPADLVDFATGFTLTEGVSLRAPAVEVIRHATGIECRTSLEPGEARALRHRQRALVAGSSCGVCGVRSLAQAVRTPPGVGGDALRLDALDIAAATEALRAHQPLHDATHAAHAAGFFVPRAESEGGPAGGMLCAREDVGRHNALDKLAGALLRAGTDVSTGVVVLTSRVSIEMVQKVAALGAPAIVAVSAPTSLAVRVARVAGITLVGGARRGAFDVHTHARRIVPVPREPSRPSRALAPSHVPPAARQARTAGRHPAEHARP